MDLNKPRYRIKAIDLSQAVFNPQEITAANTRIITFIRFAQDSDGRYPQHLNSDGFQISVDDAGEYFPIKPNDSIRALGPDPFSRITYRNLVPIDAWAILLLSEDICIDNQRPDITFPLKNCSEPEISAAVWRTAMVAVPATTDTNLYQLLVPGGNMLLVWDFNVYGELGAGPIDYYVGLFMNNVAKKVYNRRPSALPGERSFIEKRFNPPLELINTALGSVNFDIRIYHVGGGAINFGYSVDYSLLPINANSDPPGDVEPLK